MSKTKKRAIAIVLAAVLLIGAVVGGTIAWLTQATKTVTNTFTVGDINIKLTESADLDATIDAKEKNFKYIPGDVVAKDPKVTVDADSEACYLFVKVEEVNNTDLDSTDAVDKIIGWEQASDWIKYTPTNPPANTTFFYREVNANEASAGQTYSVLKNDQVQMSTLITKDMKENINGAQQPKLIFTAAAIQSKNIPTDGGVVANAFKSLPDEFTGNTTT